MNSKTSPDQDKRRQDLSPKGKWRSEFKRRLSLVANEGEPRATERRERFNLSLTRVLRANPGLWLAFSRTRTEPKPDLETGTVRFAYPRLGPERTMSFYECRNGEEQLWQKNEFGICEPDLVSPAWQAVDLTSVRGILIPALGFDRRLQRLGRGAGYYDRFLSEDLIQENASNQILKVGVGHSEQVAELLPTESHDVSLDGLVTDREMIWSVGALVNARA